jgi:flap endonuclease-1
MGIKNLTSFLLEHCPNAIKQTQLFELRGKKVAIDVSIFLYRYKYKGNKLIFKFFEQINRLRMNDITPIYIFDGIPDELKKDTINNRKNKLLDKKNKIDALKKELEDNNDVSKVSEIQYKINNMDNKIISVTKEDIYNVKYLFDLLNIKHVQAQGEADLLCSKLCSTNVVDFVISEDMDLLTSGTKLLVRDFNIYNNKITLFNLNMILEQLNITYDKWVELCIMLGCDYLKRINGVGPKKSFRYIKETGKIDDIVNDLKSKNINVDDKYLEDFEKSKQLFMNYNMDYLENTENLVKIDKLYDNQIENIKQFMFKNTNLTEKQIFNRIKNIYYNI